MRRDLAGHQAKRGVTTRHHRDQLWLSGIGTWPVMASLCPHARAKELLAARVRRTRLPVLRVQCPIVVQQPFVKCVIDDAAAVHAAVPVVATGPLNDRRKLGGRRAGSHLPRTAPLRLCGLAVYQSSRQSWM